MNDTDVQAANTDCKPKLQIGKIRFCEHFLDGKTSELNHPIIKCDIL